MNAVKTLRKALGAAVKFEKGTVVRWSSYSDYRDITYNYVAIFTGDRWFISGGERFYGTTVFNNDEFVNNVLASAVSGSIAVATEWESV